MNAPVKFKSNTEFSHVKPADTQFLPGGLRDFFLYKDLGKCGHCRIGKYYACKDGPVFTYEQLKDLRDIWD